MDYGAVRVGLAVTDPLGITAQPLVTLSRRSDRQVCREIAALVADKAVVEVVVGLPLAMDGTAGEAADQVREFVQRLTRYLRIPITLWDERLTSVEAERVLFGGGVTRARRRQVVDQVAASLMLQAVLASRSTGQDADGADD
ncbi:MAG: Holliday junction resolvase RuvX [Bradymonadales bacterium]|nr:Holliday junction resolvase RuvX [Bradymonadales bacterium]